MAGTKKIFVSNNQFCHASLPCKGIFEICFVFSHFFVRALNCSHYSNFENKCPKLGTGTSQDMLFTILGDNLDSIPSEIALICNAYIILSGHLCYCEIPGSLVWFSGYTTQYM